MADRPWIDLLNGDFYAGDARPAYRWLRDNGPLWFDECNDIWAVATYEAVLAASKDPATFSSAGGSRPDTGALPMMIDMDDPDHAKRRKLVNRGFTPRRVADRGERLAEICDAIIDGVCERGECDFVRDIAAPLPLIAIGDMLGVLPEDRDDLLRWSDIMVSSQDGGDPGKLTAASEAFREYCTYISRVIADRREQPTDDLVSVLVDAEVDGDRLDDQELIFESLLILIGGDETTRHVIAGGMEQLLRHPEQWEAMRRDRDLVGGAVEEMLRWVSPIKNFNRTLTRDAEFFGRQLRGGDRVLLLYESANLDERHFDSPERFDITRSPNDHLAFGFGTHFCLGNSLARLELRTMFGRLLERLPDIELATDEELPRRPSHFISGIEQMPVRFTPTAPVGAVA